MRGDFALKRPVVAFFQPDTGHVEATGSSAPKSRSTRRKQAATKKPSKNAEVEMWEASILEDDVNGNDSLEKPESETSDETALNVDSLEESSLEDTYEIEDDVDEVDYVERQSSPRTSEPRTGEIDFNATFVLWRETGDPALRDSLVLMHRNLVSFLARRFSGRGEGVEDIVQQGMIGLIYALDHFDPTRGVRFATFATPTIIGEIRRYFRDKTRGVRIPRRIQELHQTVSSRIDALTQQLDRSPTYWELAQSLNLPVEDVIEALEIGRAMETVSLDEPMGEDDNSSTSLVDHLGDLDLAITQWDEHSLLQAALQKLPEKHRTVLHYAYFENMSQVEIAGQMNVSQMHVSRLLRAALAQLRQHLEEER